MKHSWEQKKLPLIPSLMQVGHWSASASFSQPTPRHVREVEDILRDGIGLFRRIGISIDDLGDYVHL